MVQAQNTPPTITNIPDQSTPSGVTTGIIAFTVGDAQTPATQLSVTYSSSNTLLVPLANIQLPQGEQGATRIFLITPAAGRSGTATITVTVTDGQLTASDSFVLTVVAAGGNTPPTLSNLLDQTTTAGVATLVIDFVVGDAETPAGNLGVTTSSSNPTLVPNQNIAVGGSGANRTIQATPAAGQTGSTTITVTVSDGTATTSDAFVLTVTAVGGVNTPPTISNIADQTTAVNTPTAPLGFVIGDAQTAASSLLVTHTSSNPAVIPLAQVQFSGTGSARTLLVVPATGATGVSTITVTVTDSGGLSMSDSFTVTVGQVAVNTPPTMSTIANQSIGVSSSTGPLAFTVGDAETPVGSLILSASSGNTNLVPQAGLSLGGAGASRTITVTPAAGLSGTADISVTVNDGQLIAFRSFRVSIAGVVNTRPTVGAIADQSTTSGVATPSVAFTVADAETAAGNLTVSAASSNQALIPNGNIDLGGSAGSRTVRVRPVAGQIGVAVITVSVSDGFLSATEPFTVTVAAGAANTPPTISDIPNQATPTGVQAGPVPFTVGDAETDPNELTFVRTSSNTALVPHENILFGGSGAQRGVIIFPQAGQTGTTIISITVSDGLLSATDTFVLSVGLPPANTPPTLSSISSQTVQAGAALGPLAFTVGDAETSANLLVVTAASSNGTVIPDSAITAAGSSSVRTLTIQSQAGKTGASQISVVVSDGALKATNSFLLTVTAPANALPTISNIADQTTAAGVPTAGLAFTVGDAETTAASLVTSAASANTVLVPQAGLVISGTGATRSLVVTPAAGQSGTTTITVSVSDGTAAASDVFVLTVTPQTLTPPAIVQQPTNQSAIKGGSTTFAVTVTGSTPLSYQWLFNGGEIAGATSASYTIQNADVSHVGNYSVVVSNPAGFKISALVQLQLIEGPRISLPVILPGGFIQISITGTIGDLYDIQVTGDFNTWTTVATVFNSTGTASYIDPESSGSRKRFYRILLR